MSATIEDRPYGPESSEEEIKALESRVYLYKDNIIMLRQVPVQTIFQLDILFRKLREVTDRLESSYSLLIDLTEAHRPDAKIRAHLKDGFYPHRDRTIHVGVFTGGNVLLMVAAKFVLSRVFPSFSVHKTQEQALEAIRHAEE